MNTSAKRFTLWLSGNKDLNLKVTTLLDSLGVPYMQKEGGSGDAAPCLESASRSLSSFTKREVVDFLWAEGVKLEDS